MELQNLPWYGQLLVFLVVGAVLFGIFYFVVYSPTQDEITSIVDQSETAAGGDPQGGEERKTS